MEKDLSLKRRIKNVLRDIPFIYIPFKYFSSDLPLKKRIRCLHENGDEAMQRITKVIEDTGYEAFCDFGTLLGIIREKDFLKQDFDIDIGIVDRGDFSWDVLDEHLRKQDFRARHYFSNQGKKTEYTYVFREQLTVDFFLYTPAEDDTMSWNYYFEDTSLVHEQGEMSIRVTTYPQTHGIQKVPFRGTEVFIPCEPEKHLEAAYGKGWKVPDPNYESNTTQNILPYFGHMHMVD